MSESLGAIDDLGIEVAQAAYKLMLEPVARRFP